MKVPIETVSDLNWAVLKEMIQSDRVPFPSPSILQSPLDLSIPEHKTTHWGLKDSGRIKTWTHLMPRSLLSIAPSEVDKKGEQVDLMIPYMIPSPGSGRRIQCVIIIIAACDIRGDPGSSQRCFSFIQHLDVFKVGRKMPRRFLTRFFPCLTL